MRARKPVIPAAGFGTSVLPATKAQPNKMLPLAGKPASEADWLRATVRPAVDRPDLSPEFRACMRERVRSW